jgi:hypothetical protein
MTNSQKRADRFYLAGNVGAIALLVWGGLHVWINYILPELPESVQAAGYLARNLLNVVTMVALAWALVSLIALRNSDEFTLATWHQATTSGFFTSIIWLYFFPFAISTYTRFSGAEAQPYYDVVLIWGAMVVMAAFFVGFHLKRFRS